MRINPIVVPYIGTWIETFTMQNGKLQNAVVPYIGTWIETQMIDVLSYPLVSYLI